MTKPMAGLNLGDILPDGINLNWQGLFEAMGAGKAMPRYETRFTREGDFITEQTYFKVGGKTYEIDDRTSSALEDGDSIVYNYPLSDILFHLQQALNGHLVEVEDPEDEGPEDEDEASTTEQHSPATGSLGKLFDWLTGLVLKLFGRGKSSHA